MTGLFAPTESSSLDKFATPGWKHPRDGCPLGIKEPSFILFTVFVRMPVLDWEALFFESTAVHVYNDNRVQFEL